MNADDRHVIRELGLRYAEVAALPVQKEKRAMRIRLA